MNERCTSYNLGVNGKDEMSIEETLRCLNSEVPSPVDDRITKPAPNTLDFALNASAPSLEKTVVSILGNQSYACLKKIDDCKEDEEQEEGKEKVKHSRRGSLATISVGKESCGDSISTLGSANGLDRERPHVEDLTEHDTSSKNDETQVDGNEHDVQSSSKPTAFDAGKENTDLSTTCSASISIETISNNSESSRKKQGVKSHNRSKAKKSLYRSFSFHRKSSARLGPRRSRVRIPGPAGRGMLLRGIGSRDSVNNLIQGSEPKVNPPVVFPKKVEKVCYDDLLSEGQNYLAMSMLVYIYARLREMSILGYTNTEFKAIDVNSWKKYDPLEEETVKHEDMTVDGDGKDVEKKDEKSENKQNYLNNTKTAGSIIRVVLEELEMEEERKEEKDSLHSSNHDISVITEFRHWVNDSRSDQPDDATETAIKQLRTKVARARWRRAINRVGSSVRISRMGKIRAERRKSERSLRSQDEEDEEEEKEEKSEEDTELRSSIQRRKKFLQEELETEGELNWMRLQRLVIEDHFDGPDFHHPQGRRRSSLMIDKALEDNLPNYFKPGSVLSRMMDQGIEVVYFGDRHPNEAIYCICVHRKTKTVTIVFRGSVTAHNWLYNMKLMMSSQENPLANEEYDGCSSHFGLHTGFGLYMLKKRKDNGQRKMDEIFDKVDQIGHELDPSGNYRLSITGHSLGGALSTIFSFYAACDGRFTKVAPVRVFTYAAPRVGNIQFLHAHQHLERTGRLLHARFSNTHDMVPLTPTFAVKGTKIGPFYHHVGLQVKLHQPNVIGKALLRNFVDTVYPRPFSNRSKLWLFLSNNFVTNLSSLSGFKKNHKLSEYQRRINFAREFRTGLGQTAFFHDQKRNSLKLLEDYYRIRAHIPAPPNKICDGTVVSSNAKSIQIKSRKDLKGSMRKCVYAILVIIVIPLSVYVMSLNYMYSNDSPKAKQVGKQTHKAVQSMKKISYFVSGDGRREEFSVNENRPEKPTTSIMKDDATKTSSVVRDNTLNLRASCQIFKACLKTEAMHLSSEMQPNDHTAIFNDDASCEQVFTYANDSPWGLQSQEKRYSDLARSITAARAKQRQELSESETKISLDEISEGRIFVEGDLMNDFNNDPGTVLGPLIGHIVGQITTKVTKVSPFGKIMRFRWFQLLKKSESIVKQQRSCA